MISFNNVMLMRGTQVLLEDVNLVLHGGQRTGVIGRNGSGKTSLFLALAEEIPVESGEIKLPARLRRSIMRQETPGSDRTALEFVLDADAVLRGLETAIEQAELSGDDNELVRLHGKLEDIDGYHATNRAQQLLSGLGFMPDEFANSVSSFSGGWRVRLNLAAALMCPSELLMLDEPTNHLDLEATVWLEQWLQSYQGMLLLISHDRTFLDSVIDHVVSFEGGRLEAYTGNYSEYERQRGLRMALQQAMFVKQQRRQSEIEDFVRRFRYKASKAKQAQSRLKELNRMQNIAPAHIDSPFKFQFPELENLPSFLMQLESLSIGFDSPLVEKIDFNIQSDSRIGLLGFNGSGKSTLLRVLSNNLERLGGDIITAKKLKIGYFDQHQADALDLETTPLNLFRQLGSDRNDQQIRDFLGGFDFRGARIDETIKVFSGGEKARLALAKVAWQKPNLLLLDEPTNHLDLDMVHALTVALQGFQGALIMVSHDRHLLSSTVDEFYSIHVGKFAEFKGDLSDYEKWISQEYNQNDTATNNDSFDGKKVDKKEQRKLAAAKRERLAPLKKKEKQLESEMEKIQQQLDSIETKLADESIYDENKKAELTELIRERGAMNTTLLQMEEDWLSVHEEISSF